MSNEQPKDAFDLESFWKDAELANDDVLFDIDSELTGEDSDLLADDEDGLG